MRQYPRPRPGRSEKVLPDPIENRPEPSLTCTHGTAASRPKGLAMLLFALLLAPSMPGLAAEPHADQPKAIALIEKHRGKVGFDEKRPGRPVVSVQVGNLEFDDSALAHLAGLTQLQELDLSMTGVTDAGLKHLKGFPQLEVLHLSGSYVTDEGLPQIKALARLRVLGLALTNVTEAGTALTGALRATVNDGDGNRYVIGSSAAMTKDTTNGGILNSSTATAFPFFIGSAIAGSGAVAGDAPADLVNQYHGYLTEVVQPVMS